ncbi:MAG: AEC family transporter [Oscillospiraceae bacterium]|nr:AEC family transporter [Oscillospiraceae bacterium]
MDKLISVISTALPVFLALAMGMMCRSKGFLTRDGVDTLKKVIVNLTLPFVLFNSFATAEYTMSALILPVIIFITCTIMLALGFAWVKVSKSGSKVAPFLASGFEAGMLGFSLFALLFPDESASKFAMLVLGQEIFVFTLYKMLLTGKTSPKAIINDFLTSPTLIAVILGLIVGASGLYDCFRSWGVSTIIESVTSFISAPTGTIILFAVGFDLVLREINWKKTGNMVAMRLVIAGVMLGVLILLNRTLLNGMIFEGAAVMLFILPSPFIIPIFTDAAEERVQISSALSALTLITMILFAVCSVVVGIM